MFQTLGKLLSKYYSYSEIDKKMQATYVLMNFPKDLKNS
jgi:hypothetical protein